MITFLDMVAMLTLGAPFVLLIGFMLWTGWQSLAECAGYYRHVWGVWKALGPGLYTWLVFCVGWLAWRMLS